MIVAIVSELARPTTVSFQASTVFDIVISPEAHQRLAAMEGAQGTRLFGLEDS